MNTWIEKIKESIDSRSSLYGLVIIGAILSIGLYRWFVPPSTPFDQEIMAVAEIEESISEESQVLEEERSEIEEVTVEIKGSVINPGVYTLPANSRVVDLVDQAGGFTNDAYMDSLNQAQKLEDQMMIYVYNESTYQSLADQGELSNEEVFDPLNNNKETESGLVNINTDQLQELLSLPGIGPKKAEAIQSYRQEHGDFKAIEELMEVSGIGPKTFDSLKDLITVGH
ncbi:helix-hairpin-helix domain-containing protein [Dolosicoccus paucivorans]|uniref:helix-hairpin-helix domain-containing protein n=1 Tax=Dolosicoccus paucivorans TaxID=84521 RepID=UPI000890323F|nr:helix-hairpin-helix domain-containing protein [Dolosicoccus paucivorans]SDI42661.1 competence protein ComEA [Dolosicoccus paucivorans]